MKCINCGKDIEEGKEVKLDDETNDYVCSDECLDAQFGSF